MDIDRLIASSLEQAKLDHADEIAREKAVMELEVKDAMDRLQQSVTDSAERERQQYVTLRNEMMEDKKTPLKNTFQTPHTKRPHDVAYANRMGADDAQHGLQHIPDKTIGVAALGPTLGEDASTATQYKEPATFNGNFGGEHRPLGPPPNSNTNTENSNTGTPPNDHFSQLLGTLTTMVGKMNSSSSTKDISEPPKFSGKDVDWESWHKLLRSYLKSKRWLTTFDHPTGPGTTDTPTPDFNVSGWLSRLFWKL